MSFRHFLDTFSLCRKDNLKKPSFRGQPSFYGCHFCEAKGRLKDIFSYCRKDNMKKISFRYFDTFYLIREQYAKLPPNGRDGVQFLSCLKIIRNRIKGATL